MNRGAVCAGGAALSGENSKRAWSLCPGAVGSERGVRDEGRGVRDEGV